MKGCHASVATEWLTSCHVAAAAPCVSPEQATCVSQQDVCTQAAVVTWMRHAHLHVARVQEADLNADVAQCLLDGRLVPAAAQVDRDFPELSVWPLLLQLSDGTIQQVVGACHDDDVEPLLRARARQGLPDPCKPHEDTADPTHR